MRSGWHALSVLLCLLAARPADAEAPVSWRLNRDDGLIQELGGLPIPSVGDDDTGLSQLLNRTRIDVGDKKVTKRVTNAWHFANVEAIQSYGTKTIRFDALTERVTVHEAAVLTAKGERIPFDPARQQVIDTDSYDMFTDEKELVISFSGLETGSLAILDYEITSQRDYEGMGWSERVFPQQLVARTLFELRVTWKPNEPVLWTSSSKWATCEAGTGSLVCVGRDIPAAQTDHVVFWQDELGHIAISDIRQWSEVADRLRPGLDAAVRANEGAEKVLAVILEGKGSLEDRIGRLHDFVARKVRYVSMSEAAHRIKPHAVADTLRNRYGDCKDKSTVLMHLLDRIGINAYPVLVATNIRKPDSLLVPSPWYFDHMVVCFDYQGEEKCLDATDSYTDWRTIPAWIQGAASLALVPGGVPSTIPMQKYRWDMAIDTDIRFTTKGGQRESQVRKYRGAYAGALRGTLAGNTNADIVRWASEQYRKTVSDLAEPVFEFQGIEQVGEDVRLSSVTEFEALADVEDDLNYAENDAWVLDEIESLYVKNKLYGVFFPGLRIESNHQIDTAGHWILVSGGPNVTFIHDYGAMTRTISIEGKDKAKVATRIEIPSRQVAVSEIKEFNKFLDLLKRESAISISGKKK
ncbi:MAG: DUF3857 and transglutaminase domain-containing protein [Candidatus Omnitrophica bacterium]|nr:DUF3857 and transglutaminase domain-containing protein [Candidatus Omnitrophota bacterium]